MKFKRRFYSSSINLSNLNKKNIFFGIFLGVLAAIILYAFFSVFLESLRIMSLENDFPKLLNDSFREIFKVFFAGLSVIIGNSVFICFLFSSQRNILSHRNPKRKRILVDQIFLNGGFMHWFVKLSSMFGIFYIWYINLDLFSYFLLPMILILIVLYFESWKTLSLIFKKNRFKIQFIHLIIMSISAYILSLVQVIDYKKIDKIILEKNPIINLPHSNFYHEKDSRYFYPSMKLKLYLDNNEVKIKTEDGETISLDDVQRKITEKRALVREELIHFLTIRLIIDKDIDLSYVKAIEAELFSINQFRIRYDVYNDNIYSKYYENVSLNKRISSDVLQFKKNSHIPLPPLPFEGFEGKTIYNDTLKIRIGKEIIINDQNVSNEMLFRKFQNYINGKTLFLYEYSSLIKYESYITVLSAHMKAIDFIREKNKKVKLKEIDFKYINREDFLKDQNRLKRDYPFMMIETKNY